MRTPHNERLTSDIADERTASLGADSEAVPSDGKRANDRKCVLSGQNHPRGIMVRLALSPSGLVLPDVQAKAPGRGAWLSVDRASLEHAIAEKRLKPALSRALKTGDVHWAEELPRQIEDALLRLFLDRLGLELRFGHLLMGSQRIVTEARKGAVHALYHASDAQPDGTAKLDQAWRVGEGKEGSGLCGTRLPLDRAALSVALGRENVVHLALTDAAAAGRIDAILARLIGYIGTDSYSADAERVRDDERNT